MNKLHLSPSLMCADLLNLEEELKILKEHQFDYLHIDIMDGHFVPNITFGFDFVNRIDEMTSALKDVHLMMNHPELALENLTINKNDLITFHIECKSDINAIIRQIKDKGGKAGLAINPDTPVEALYPYLGSIDRILVMTVQPGFAGRPFVASSHKRLMVLSDVVRRDFPHVIIGIDGAIGFNEIERFGAMGVRHFVLGTTVLFNGDLAQQAAKVINFANNLEGAIA